MAVMLSQYCFLNVFVSSSRSLCALCAAPSLHRIDSSRRAALSFPLSTVDNSAMFAREFAIHSVAMDSRYQGAFEMRMLGSLCALVLVTSIMVGCEPNPNGTGGTAPTTTSSPTTGTGTSGTSSSPAGGSGMTGPGTSTSGSTSSSGNTTTPNP